jgi:beta-phosphoglucomutase-like phosphatase (HAD superfamily)
VARLLEAAAAAGIPQVIVTTSGRAAVSALLEQVLPRSEQLFRFWVCGEDVARKKPDPEAYRLALAQLGCDAAQAVAIEDSGNGLRAAVDAGLSTLVTRSASSAAEPAEAFSAAAGMVDHLGEPGSPCVRMCGPACPDGHITLSYLQQLLQRP